MIGGTMGVGKSTTAAILNKRLPDSVLLDGDWCWMADPFQVTDETKDMVLDNICHLMNNFIGCSAYENIVFCWVMHEQKIINDIIGRLHLDGCEIVGLSLVCDADSLEKRLRRDVEAGIRTDDVIERSIARLPMYDLLDTQKIDVSTLSPDEAAEIIAKL